MDKENTKKYQKIIRLTEEEKCLLDQLVEESHNANFTSFFKEKILGITEKERKKITYEYTKKGDEKRNNIITFYLTATELETLRARMKKEGIRSYAKYVSKTLCSDNIRIDEKTQKSLLMKKVDRHIDAMLKMIQKYNNLVDLINKTIFLQKNGESELTKKDIAHLDSRMKALHQVTQHLRDEDTGLLKILIEHLNNIKN